MFNYNSNMTWAELMQAPLTEEEIKHRAKYYIFHTTDQTQYRNICTAEPGRNGKLMLIMFEFYWQYAKAKGLNPLIPIIQTINETSFMTYNSGVPVTYKNTAGIKVDHNVINFYERLHGNNSSDHQIELHKKFERWPDSIMAQIDHILLFLKLDTCCLDNNMRTHLTWDPEHHTNIVPYDRPRHAGNNEITFTPTIGGMFGKIINGEQVQGAYSTTPYGHKVVDRLNLIVYNDTEDQNAIPDNYEYSIFDNYTGNENVDYIFSESDSDIVKDAYHEIQAALNSERALAVLENEAFTLLEESIEALDRLIEAIDS